LAQGAFCVVHGVLSMTAPRLVPVPRASDDPCRPLPNDSRDLSKAIGNSRPCSAGSFRAKHEDFRSNSVSRRPYSARTGRPQKNAEIAITALEEELGHQPLKLVPEALGTELEKKFSEALGITKQKKVLRLPLDVRCCLLGGQCCWRWLARAALEVVSGMPLGHLSLPQMVSSLRDEIKMLRMTQASKLSLESEVKETMETLSSLQETHATALEELRELRAKLREFERLQAENAELRVNNGRLSAMMEGFSREFATAKLDHLHAIEAELTAYRNQAQEAEQELSKTRRLEQENSHHLTKYKEEFEKIQAENASMKATLVDLLTKKSKRHTSKGQSSRSPSRRATPGRAGVKS